MGEIKSLTGVLLLLLLSVFPYTNASTSNSFFFFFLLDAGRVAQSPIEHKNKNEKNTLYKNLRWDDESTVTHAGLSLYTV
jgi:hypothetical protein